MPQPETHAFGRFFWLETFYMKDLELGYLGRFFKFGCLRRSHCMDLCCSGSSRRSAAEGQECVVKPKGVC